MLHPQYLGSGHPTARTSFMTSASFIELHALRGLEDLRQLEASLARSLSEMKRVKNTNQAKEDLGRQLSSLQDHVAQVEQLVARLS